MNILGHITHSLVQQVDTEGIIRTYTAEEETSPDLPASHHLIDLLSNIDETLFLPIQKTILGWMFNPKHGVAEVPFCIDSFASFPWIQTLSEGLIQTYYCKRCDRKINYAEGELRAILDKKKGTKWSDVIGCGHFPFFIVSENVIKAWKQEGITDIPYHKVWIENPLPKRLTGTKPPEYFWIDGKKMKGALLDFDSSGFVGVEFCTECGTRTDNISATYDKQWGGFSYFFKKDSWNGTDLFTTDLSETAFFCTEKLVECAIKYRLTNFRFVPIEQGGGDGIKYLKR